MSGPLLAVFPPVGPRMREAFHDLRRAEDATTATEILDLGPLELLPRPWDPATITSPELRVEVWCWLDAVVGWLNTQHAWEVGDLVPACWPRHPHLVRDIGTLADQRRRAGVAFTSDALEDWQRNCLTSFHDRMRARYRGFCEDGHRDAPGATRTTRYTAPAAVAERQALYEADAGSLPSATGPASPRQEPGAARFGVVDGMLIDPRTGEVIR